MKKIQLLTGVQQPFKDKLKILTITLWGVCLLTDFFFVSSMRSVTLPDSFPETDIPNQSSAQSVLSLIYLGDRVECCEPKLCIQSESGCQLQIRKKEKCKLHIMLMLIE